MRKLMCAVLGLTFFVPGAADAQLFLGARAGYSFAGGDLYKDNSIKDSIRGMVPIQVDFGIDVAKAVALGVYGSVGFTMLGKELKDSCDATGVDCSGLNLRLGAQATLHAPVSQIKVWGGPLLGWEQQHFKVSGGGNSLEVDYRGVEVGLQGGVDFAPAGSFRWGPFVSASVGQFQSSALTVSGGGGAITTGLQPIPSKSQHTWLTVGLRGVFGL